MRKLQTHLAFTCCLLQGPRCSGQQIPIKAVDVEGHCTGRQPAIEFSLADRLLVLLATMFCSTACHSGVLSLPDPCVVFAMKHLCLPTPFSPKRA
eukprot:scaffold179686_cov19-Tisochrysis_lutea.AAC.1